MKKYKATFEIGWMHETIEGDTPSELIQGVENVQDLRCLLQMGATMEPNKGKPELRKLESFLEKYYDNTLTINDIKSLDIQLSIGSIKCTDLIEQ